MKTKRTTKKQRQQVQAILDLLGDLFRDMSIGLYPVRNDNGSDEYQCPSCSATKKTLGWASGQEPLHTVEHDTRCDLHLLYTLYQEYEANKEPETTEE